MWLLVNISRSKYRDKVETLHYIYKSWSSNYEQLNNDDDDGIAIIFRWAMLFVQLYFDNFLEQLKIQGNIGIDTKIKTTKKLLKKLKWLSYERVVN
jgi:hypothetical protein